MKKLLAVLSAVAALVLFASPSQAQDRVSKFTGNQSFLNAIIATQGKGICYKRCYGWSPTCLQTERRCTQVTSATYCKQWGTHCSKSEPICKARNAYGVCTDYDAKCLATGRHCVQVAKASYCTKYENVCVKKGQTCSKWGQRCYYRACNGTTKTCVANKELCLKPAKVCTAWGTHCASSEPKCVKQNAYGVCIDFDANCTGQGKHCTQTGVTCAQKLNVCTQYKFACTGWSIKFRDRF